MNINDLKIRYFRNLVIQKLNTTIHKLLSLSPSKRTDYSSIEDNPLVGYLKIYQNQHKLIYVFYRGLIFSFSCFFLLISFFIFNARDSIYLPKAGFFILILIDLLLLLFVAKIINEFKKYRKKSESTLSMIYDHLQKDLAQLEFIKAEHTLWQSRGNRFGREIRSENKQQQKKTTAYTGWDHQLCPHCNAQVEMLETTCPNCDSALIKTIPF